MNGIVFKGHARAEKDVGYATPIVLASQRFSESLTWIYTAMLSDLFITLCEIVALAFFSRMSVGLMPTKLWAVSIFWYLSILMNIIFREGSYVFELLQIIKSRKNSQNNSLSIHSSDVYGCFQTIGRLIVSICPFILISKYTARLQSIVDLIDSPTALIDLFNNSHKQISQVPDHLALDFMLFLPGLILGMIRFFRFCVSGKQRSRPQPYEVLNSDQYDTSSLEDEYVQPMNYQVVLPKKEYDFPLDLEAPFFIFVLFSWRFSFKTDNVEFFREALLRLPYVSLYFYLVMLVAVVSVACCTKPNDRSDLCEIISGIIKGMRIIDTVRTVFMTFTVIIVLALSKKNPQSSFMYFLCLLIIERILVFLKHIQNLHDQLTKIKKSNK